MRTHHLFTQSYPTTLFSLLGILFFSLIIAANPTHAAPEPAKVTVKPLKTLRQQSEHSAPARVISLNQS